MFIHSGIDTHLGFHFGAIINSIVLNHSLYTSNVYIRTNVSISAGYITYNPAVYSRCEGIFFLIPLHKREVVWEGKVLSLVCYLCLPLRSHERENFPQSSELSVLNKLQFIESFLCAKCFVYVISFNPHKKPSR